MSRRAPTPGFAAAALAALILAAPLPSLAVQAATTPRPKLIVAISVDQFSLDLFQAYRPGFSGGLARLAKGRVYAGYQSHAATETCPGHSTLLTGAHPSRTGIVANSWWDRRRRQEVYCAGEDDEASDSLTRTSARLKVDTLGDWMRRADPRSQVVSVAGKDRAAIMMAGHRPSAVYWWRDRAGFTTSPGAGPSGPAELAPAEAFNREAFAAWTRTPPRLWPAAPPGCASRGSPLSVGAVRLSGRTPQPEPAAAAAGGDWPHGAAFAGELRGSPELDALVLRFAVELAEARGLGRGAATDLLAVGLSATDSIGHRYGPGGVEMCAQMSALDAALGGFLERLDRLRTPYVVVLSADHGGIDAAERLSPVGPRIDVKAVRAELAAALQAQFGLEADPLRGEDARQLVIELPPARAALRPRVIAAAVAWLNRRPEVTRAFSAGQVAAARPQPGKHPTDLTLAERFNESFDPERSGDVLVAYAPRATLGIPATPRANVAGHGSPWDYDRRVPILFWWPGVDHRAPPTAIETVDIAPTLAACLGLPTPAVDGRRLDFGRRCTSSGRARKTASEGPRG